MDTSKKSPVAAFFKLLFCAAFIVGVFLLGGLIGYKRGFQKTADFTVNKLGVQAEIKTYEDYNNALDAYIKESKSPSAILENIGEMTSDFLQDLFK